MATRAASPPQGPGRTRRSCGRRPSSSGRRSSERHGQQGLVAARKFGRTAGDGCGFLDWLGQSLPRGPGVPQRVVPARSADARCLPRARPQRMPLACSVARRSCLLRGCAASPLHQLLLAGAACCEASPHAASIHGCRQELPLAKLRNTPFASIGAVRKCRLRGIDAGRLHLCLLAGAAACEVPAHAACIH